ncbi:hypothetical protein N7478_012033 [Penicillium angulare]|uniref:uncharacterized protein n=1 Tax=Penicillium angulare TaxID=116970 RepID=UPI00253FA948|nr:uncharacterized protein N7478_012033 [Penicillium angulare]KAJ5261438.1 hypothetical protein N7478_012033 [Penicillium angulare]
MTCIPQLPVRDSEELKSYLYGEPAVTGTLPEKRNEKRNLNPPHLPYRIDKYSLTDGDTLIGTVTHFVSNIAINGNEKGADELFSLLQDVDIGLRRYRVKAPIVPEMMTKSLLKIIVLYLSGYAHFDWAFDFVNQDDGMEKQRANEMLIIGYLKGHGIKWHNDGNERLEPTIATLCLGAKAKMSFRMKPLYYRGANKQGILLTEDHVVKGCRNYVRRKILKEQYSSGELLREEYDNERRKLIQKSSRERPTKTV